MSFRTMDCLSIALFFTMSAGALASDPVGFKLAQLVPPGAQIVSAMAAVHSGQHWSGSLLFITRLNALDLQDWLALAGADPNRSYKEAILASFAPPGQIFREHLLLVAGTFQRDRIFSAAESNGARRFTYLAEAVVGIEPFARERVDLTETRWLTILENRTAVFGTPWIVKQVLHRFAGRNEADPQLTRWLAQLNPDVNYWSIMTPLPEAASRVFLDSGSPWVVLFEGTDVVMLGVHTDAKVRIDIVFRTARKFEPANLNSKIAQFGKIFIREGDYARRLHNTKMDESCMRTSITLSNKEFLEWSSDQISRNRKMLDLAHQKEGMANSPNLPQTGELVPPRE